MNILFCQVKLVKRHDIQLLTTYLDIFSAIAPLSLSLSLSPPSLLSYEAAPCLSGHAERKVYFVTKRCPINGGGVP